jgi:hypothetical protein
MVQHFIGNESGVAWPGQGRLPNITGPLHEVGEENIEQRRAELLAWMNAYPAPGARLEGTDVLAWYGVESAPTLRLRPLPLA